MIFMLYFSAILVLALWIPSHVNATVLIFTALYGFSSRAFIGLESALVAQISEVREIGVRTGTFYAISSIAALTGNPIGGALVPDIFHGTFWKLQVFSGAGMLAGSTFFLMARVYLAGLNSTKRSK
jgi:MFS family permease